MNKKETDKMFFAVLYVFVIIGIFCEWCDKFLDTHQIDHRVLSGGNILLMGLTMLSLVMFRNAMKNANPNVFIRTVMGATFMKLMVLAICIAAYLYFAGASRSLYAVLCTMGLYIIYTIMEVRFVLKMNRQFNGKS